MRRPTLFLGLLLITVVCLVGIIRAERCCLEPLRGNVDYSVGDIIDIADLVFLVDYMFNAGSPPPCNEEADMNGDGAIDIADLVYLVDYMFSGGLDPLPCPSDVVDSVILPLAIGNQWTTFVTEYNQSGQTIDEYTATGTVVGDSTIEDWTWYLMVSDTAGADSSLWTNKEDGAWAWTDSAGAPEALMLKYPASPGESYPVYDVTVTVESISTSITVPAGTFDCHYYRAHIPIFGTIGKIWAVPNIGVVRAEEYSLTLFGTYLSREVELLDYSLVVP